MTPFHRIQWMTTVVARTLLVILLSTLPARAQDVVVKIVDTGRGGFDENCDPGFEPPFCPLVQTAITHSSYLAAQIVLTEATTLDSVKLWASTIVGGYVTVRIYNNVNDLPGRSIYSHRYFVEDRQPYNCQIPGGKCIDWLAFDSFTHTLAAGTYWIAFEPDAGMEASLPIGAPAPLPRYVMLQNPADGWLTLQCQLNVSGLSFPPGGCGGDPQYINFGSVGIQVFGTRHVVSSATAARGILRGTYRGKPITPIDQTSGGVGQDADAPAYDVNVGAGVGAARLSGTFSARVFGWTTGPGVTEATGAARAVVFGEWRNDTGEPLDVRANAVLDGFVAPSPQYGHVTAAVYIFDKDQFRAEIESTTLPLKDFLLKAESLSTFAAVDGTNFQSTFSLARRFPAAALKEQVFHIERLSALSTLGVAIPVNTPITRIDPGASVIIVLDISHYQPPGGGVLSFYDSLKPAPVFLTGPDGNASPLTPVDTSLPAPPAPAHVALSPETTTSQIGTAVTITATVTGASGEAVRDTPVHMQVTSGPNAHPPIPILTDSQGRVTFSYTGGSDAGTDEIRANIGVLQSNVARVAWTSPGLFDHITITPATATIAAGASQTYTAVALDLFDNSIGNVTSTTTFTISPSGSCTGATCTASVPGTHTVTATYEGKTASATLQVTATSAGFTFGGFFDPVEMSTPELVVWNTLKAGQTVPVKWLLTTEGMPVSDAASFVGLASYQVACMSGTASVEDAIEQTATGNSGLQYSGGGYWQFNWETSKAFRGTCRAVTVRFSDGTTSPSALFKFK